MRQRSISYMEEYRKSAREDMVAKRRAIELPGPQGSHRV